MDARLVLVTISVLFYCTAYTMDSAFVVEYSGVKISFSEEKFIDFYTCLCNSVKIHCWAVTEPTQINVNQVNISTVDSKYASADGVDKFTRTCNVYGSKDFHNFTVNCTKSDKSDTHTHILRLIEHDSCIHYNVSLKWPPNVILEVNKSLIQMSETESRNRGCVHYCGVMTLLLKTTGILILVWTLLY